MEGVTDRQTDRHRSTHLFRRRWVLCWECLSGCSAALLQHTDVRNTRSHIPCTPAPQHLTFQHSPTLTPVSICSFLSCFLIHYILETLFFLYALPSLHSYHCPSSQHPTLYPTPCSLISYALILHPTSSLNITKDLQPQPKHSTPKCLPP